MPPITSSRPGALLNRKLRPKAKWTPSSGRTREISVGIGSRLRRWLGGGGTGWRGRGRLGAGRCCRHGLALGGIRALRRLEHNLVMKPPAVAQLKLRGEYVRV